MVFVGFAPWPPGELGDLEPEGSSSSHWLEEQGCLQKPLRPWYELLAPPVECARQHGALRKGCRASRRRRASNSEEIAASSDAMSPTNTDKKMVV
eukprot:s2779_g13.t1